MGGKQGKGWNILKLRIPNAENTKVADKFLKEGREEGEGRRLAGELKE